MRLFGFFHFSQTHSEAQWLKNTVVVVTGEAGPLLIRPLIYGTPTTATSPHTRAKIPKASTFHI